MVGIADISAIKGECEDKIMERNFGWALDKLKAGIRVRRAGWNGKDMYIELQVPDEHSKMRKPYIFMRPVDGEFVPWFASQTDMLASDWEVAPG